MQAPPHKIKKKKFEKQWRVEKHKNYWSEKSQGIHVLSQNALFIAKNYCVKVYFWTWTREPYVTYNVFVCRFLFNSWINKLVKLSVGPENHILLRWVGKKTLGLVDGNLITRSFSRKFVQTTVRCLSKFTIWFNRTLLKTTFTPLRLPK